MEEKKLTRKNKKTGKEEIRLEGDRFWQEV